MIKTTRGREWCTHARRRRQTPCRLRPDARLQLARVEDDLDDVVRQRGHQQRRARLLAEQPRVEPDELPRPPAQRVGLAQLMRRQLREVADSFSSSPRRGRCGRWTAAASPRPAARPRRRSRWSPPASPRPLLCERAHDDLNLGAPLPARARLWRAEARDSVIERARVGRGFAALRRRTARARVATGAAATGRGLRCCARAMGGRACGANQLGDSACRQPPADASGVAPPALAPAARCVRMFEANCAVWLRFAPCLYAGNKSAHPPGADLGGCAASARPLRARKNGL